MHVAIIMDGNGRWAGRRGLPRSAGHAAGAKTVRKIVEAAARAGVHTLTLYAFSSDNWGRPAAEVAALMRLLRRFLITEAHRCVEQLVRVNVIGRRDRLDAGLLRVIEQSERLTDHGTRLHLRIAVDYSAQHSILAAAQRCTVGSTASPQEFLRLLNEVCFSAAPTREVDLLIRTGGEKRLSDFLLWECAYAELYFADCLWPDFEVQHFQQALDEYSGRQRRFGRLAADSG